MKLRCELCGGVLQVNLGGQSATCLNCGLTYPMERLREMLTGKTSVVQDPPKRAQEEEIIHDVKDWSVVPPASYPDEVLTPQQFVMENGGNGIGDLSGRVQQGGIGLGDKVYIDGNYDHAYQIYSINDDPYTTCAKEGMPAELFLAKCPKKVLKTARTVTGDPNPVANAYNYPGTVREYFNHLLTREFGDYEIRMDMSHEELNIPVTYMLCRDGKPVLAVFLIDSNDGKGRYQVEKAARVLAPEGISCTHFFENYRNDMPYVIDRVRCALG